MASHKWHRHPQWSTGGGTCDHLVWYIHLFHVSDVWYPSFSICIFHDVRQWLANAITLQSSLQDYAECFFGELSINFIACYGDFLFLRNICYKACYFFVDQKGCCIHPCVFLKYTPLNRCVCKLLVLCFCLVKGVCLIWYRNLLFSKPPLRRSIIPRGASVWRVDCVVISKVIFSTSWLHGAVTSTLKLTRYSAWIGVKVEIDSLSHQSRAVITVITSDIDRFHFYTRPTI